VKRSVIAFVSFAVLAGFAQLASAQAPKIGVVNVQRLVQESPQWRALQQSMDAEFGPQQREIVSLGQTLKAREDKLTKDRSTMTAAQVTAAERELRDGYIDLQAKQDKAEDRFNARRNEEMAKLQGAVLEEVQKYARANSFDLILADGVLFASNSLDVTAPVLQALQARPAGSAPAAPAPAKP